MEAPPDFSIVSYVGYFKNDITKNRVEALGAFHHVIFAALLRSQSLSSYPLFTQCARTTVLLLSNREYGQRPASPN